MGQTRKVDFSKCNIFESTQYRRNEKHLSKKHPGAKAQLCKFKDFILRPGMLADLRYQLTVRELNCDVYYTRWIIDTNIGKSGNARIWFAHLTDKDVLLFLCGYKHSDGVEDIKESDAIKFIKKAIDDWQCN